MKCIPKRELIQLIDSAYSDDSIVSKETVSMIFDQYGDEYYKASNSELKQITENERRKKLQCCKLPTS